MNPTLTQPANRNVPAPEPLNADDTMLVIAWNDPVIEQTAGAIRTDSDDALVWYTPVLGPTAMLLAHRLARYTADGPSEWNAHDLALTFGMYGPRHTVRLARSIGRLERFGVGHRAGNVLAVRLWLPPLTFQQRVRLPDYLAAAHESR